MQKLRGYNVRFPRFPQTVVKQVINKTQLCFLIKYDVSIGFSAKEVCKKNDNVTECVMPCLVSTQYSRDFMP